MNFASDNAAPVAPEIMAAIVRANEGGALAYGNDAWTKRVEQRFAQVFERDVAVYLVPTGTAANASGSLIVSGWRVGDRVMTLLGGGG
jgi:threonine aldolase